MGDEGVSGGAEEPVRREILPSPRLRGEGLGVRGRRLNPSKRYHRPIGLGPVVARQQVTFSCLAKRKFTKEKATPFAGLRLPAANSLKPGNAETRFAMISKEAKLEHPHCC